MTPEQIKELAAEYIVTLADGRLAMSEMPDNRDLLRAVNNILMEDFIARGNKVTTGRYSPPKTILDDE